MHNLELNSPQIVADTPDWWVVSKPPGWLCIPGRSTSEGRTDPVLTDWLKGLQSSPVWIVHRIDRETSGLVLFAKTPQAHTQANGWFSQRKVKKVYRLLAQGKLGFPMLKINEPIEGAPSSTQIERLEVYSSTFLAQALPRTGRRHQIRIHMAQQGFPLLGDTLYGGPREVECRDGQRLNVNRVALHASELELPSGEKFVCPDPQDFAQWIAVLKKDDQNAKR